MTTLAAVILFGYTLGGVWEIGPFTDLRSCQEWRAYQLAWGIKDVTECQALIPVEDARPQVTKMGDE